MTSAYCNPSEKHQMLQGYFVFFEFQIERVQHQHSLNKKKSDGFAQ
jgi:hypothetical protein